MEALAVVPGLEEDEYVTARFCVGGVVGMVDCLCLEGFEEALHRRVVEGITLAAHGRSRTDVSQGSPVGGCSILRPAVRVCDQARLGPLACDGHAQRGKGQLATHRSDRPARSGSAPTS